MKKEKTNMVAVNSVSVVIITLNEESCIKRAIDSIIDFCDEIVLVDSGSIDSTLEIVSKYKKVRVFNNLFLGYASQKNFGISQARGKWIFILDADEYISSELGVFIKNGSLDINSLYRVVRENYLWGKWLKSSAGSDLQDRLFANNGIHYKSEVHEYIPKGNLNLSRAPGYIYHKPNLTSESIFQKQISYTRLEAQKVSQQSKSTMWLILRPFVRFFWTLIVKKSILDGRRGLAWALVTMTYDAMVAVRTLEAKYNWYKLPKN